MNAEQRGILARYLADTEIDILSVMFLKGGNISMDELTIHYYRKTNSDWYLFTDIVDTEGNIESSSVKAIR